MVDLDAIVVDTAERGRAARLRLTDHGHDLLRAAAVVVRELDETWSSGELDPAQLRAALLHAARQLRDADSS